MTQQTLAQALNKAPFSSPKARAEALARLYERLDVSEGAASLQALIAADAKVEALIGGIALGSPFLTTIIVDDPAAALATLTTPPDTRLEALVATARAAADSADDDAVIGKALRLFRRDLAFLAACCDIGGVWPLMRITGALTLCADTAVQAAVRYLFRMAADDGMLLPPDPAAPEKDSGYIVLAMGKHGAFELNYSSDIDLIVFFDPDKVPVKPGKEPAPFLVRLTQRLVKLLQERTEWGYVFRTDLRLRPDPGSMPVAISVPAALNYYETLGQTWERSAMIKARPCAGDLKAGEAFLREMQPFVWRKYLDYASIGEVHAMKRQIHAFKGHEAIALLGHNIKLGRGGIREIEFFVQTQQLIAGGRNPALRLRDTLTGLIELTKAGWVEPAQRDTLTTAYLYLRGVEHRLQMVADEQTHSLPAEELVLAEFVQFLGYPTIAAFEEELTFHLRHVQESYSTLFEDMPQGDEESFGALDLAVVPPRSNTVLEVQKFGYHDPVAAIALVQGWLGAERGGLRARAAKELLADFAPILLRELGKTGEPDRAVLAFDRLLTSNSQPIELLTILKTHPNLLDILGDILGAAPHLSELIGRRAHILDALLEPAFFGAMPTEEQWRHAIEARMIGARDYEDRLDRARIFAQEQQFLVGVRVISGTLSADAAGSAFARLAEVCIASLVQAAMDVVLAQHGTVAGMRFAVIAMGKLGGHEITATSDLDLIVLYDHDLDASASDGPRPLMTTQYFARLTQRIIAALSAPTAEGRLYEVDFRLRPSGRSGPVASRIDSFAAYQLDEAWTWEHMALTRARVIWASDGFAAEVDAAIHTILTKTRKPKLIAGDVRDMRKAIAEDKGQSDVWNLKHASGGLVDIEFIAQTLQLVHAHAHPDVLDQNTARAIDKAGHAGLIDEDDRSVLHTACTLYHNLTQVVRVCLDEPFDPKTAPLRLKQLLARAGELPDFRTLDAYLRETQRAVRKIFVRLIGKV